MPRSARLSLHPYRMPSDDCLEVGTWSGGCGDDASVLPLGDRLRNWASDRTLSIRVPVKVNAALAWNQCLLDRSPEAVLAVVARLRCPSTNYSVAFASETIEEPTGGTSDISLEGSISGNLLADRVSLVVELLVMQPGPDPSSLNPQLPASRLITSEPKQLVLEGIGGQFPMRAVDFNDLTKLRDHRTRALWYLEFGNAELTDDFHGGLVRLLLNTEHPDYTLLEDEVSPAVGSILATDIASQLIHRLAAVPAGELPEEGDLPPTSVGGVAKAVARELLGDLPHQDLVNRVRRDPGLVNSLCQAHYSIRMYDDEEPDA